MASFPGDGNPEGTEGEIASSPSEGCKGIGQSRAAEVIGLARRLENLTLESPQGDGETKEKEPALQDSPGGRAVPGRTLGYRRRSKMGRKKVEGGILDRLNFAAGISPSDYDLADVDVTRKESYETLRVKRPRGSTGSKPTKKTRGPGSGLCSNLGQPSVW